ncbi:PREDICTED: uncharacterized protein LOC109478880 [Branchiostoma belcheri]|uniref:Uncharacterized protein LOC109478880 n=1 Tax=Branchiostoma belcheri TaxID=7741 RepID=A0A6P5A3D5_BRABE|nr:PREDICTED: uncharacterized protein LOC109478880 [Branchiostoma belcheri]
MANEVLIVNCDGTYPLDSVVSLFQSVTKGKEVVTHPLILQLSQLQAVSEKVRRRQLLCGVFVVNAYESRLSINEENAGIGYAVLYRALLEAAQGRVLVVIGGDDRYKDGEQDNSVLSTWAYHKIAAQFDDSYLDGRRGFVFSWDEQHNPVHEEALGRYFVAILSGQCGLEEPFKPNPKVPSSLIPPLKPGIPLSTSIDLTDNSLLDKTQTGPFTPYTIDHFDDNETGRIIEELEKCKKKVQEEDPDRTIRFVAYRVNGKLVPGFGTFFGDFPDDLPKYMKAEIRHADNTQIAGVIVYDEGSKKTLSLQVFDLFENEGGFIDAAKDKLSRFAQFCGWIQRK